MNRIFNIILYLIVLAIIISCRKDHVPLIENEETENCDCIPVPQPSGFSTGDNYIPDSIRINFVRWNPNNENQIAFINRSAGMTNSLMVYDFSTLTSTTLHTGNYISHIQWVQENWIVFNTSDAQIWKIKTNGDSLTQITSTGSPWFHPVLSSTGDSLCVKKGTSWSPFPNMIFDFVSGVIIDSIPHTINAGCWAGSPYIGTINGDQLSIFDTQNKSIIHAQNADIFPNYLGVLWKNQTEIIVSNVNGIYKYNIASETFDLIKCSCSSRFYSVGSFNSNRTKLLCVKFEHKRISDNEIIESGKPVVISLEDGSENELNIAF